jgi:uncharacterized peroxidase-related enzyme
VPEKLPFTMDELVWRSWSRPVKLDDCTPSQLAVLEESDPSATTNEYYLTLLRDEKALKARSELFNAIMYGREGARRAWREFAATAESRENGCVYCASVHSRLFVTFSKDRPSMEALLADGAAAALPPALAAVAAFSRALAATPPRVEPAHLEALRAEGFSDAEIVDIGNAVAMFAWANRLMLTLGEPEHAGG